MAQAGLKPIRRVVTGNDERGRSKVVWDGPARGRVLMRRDFMPCAWHEGVLLAALEGMKARAVQVRGSRLEVLDSEYLVCWE